MSTFKVKSFAKINLALNVVEKKSSLHKIETIVSFINLHDKISIKEIKSKKHNIFFTGKFSKNIGKKNTVNKLMQILEKKRLLKNRKFYIKINKLIPSKAGLGGGSMNAANILRFFKKKGIIKSSEKELFRISNSIGSDVILGLNSIDTVINSKNRIKRFKNNKKFHTLIVKPNFGCSTKYIYSKVIKFNKPQLNKISKRMFNFDNLRKMNNSLEEIAFSKYPKLRILKSYLISLSKPLFVRMTGSGSALVAYYLSKERCEKAKKQFNRKFKNYWCISSKTI